MRIFCLAKVLKVLKLCMLFLFPPWIGLVTKQLKCSVLLVNRHTVFHKIGYCIGPKRPWRKDRIVGFGDCLLVNGFVVYSLCNMAQLEITVLYKTRTVKMFCYQGETNCCVLENKQKPLTWKGHWAFSCVRLCTLSVSCCTPVSGLWKSLQNLLWRLLHRCKTCLKSENSFKC